MNQRRGRTVTGIIATGIIMFAASMAVNAQTKLPTEARTWKDSTGAFSVEARLLEIEGASVELQKADGRVVTVPIAALCEEDQTYVETLKRARANPFAGGEMRTSEAKPDRLRPSTGQGLKLLEPTHNPQVLSVDGRSVFVKSDESAAPLGPGGQERRPQWTPFVKGMFKYDAYTKRSPPILLDAEELTFAFSAHRESNAVADEHFGRIFVYRDGKRHDDLVVDVPVTLRIFDHHIASDTSLVVVGLDNNSQRGGDIALLRGVAAGNPEAIARWHVPQWNKPGFKPKVEYAKLIDESRAVVQVNNVVYVWDLSTGECSCLVENLNASGKIRVSANGRYLALPEARMCRMVDLVEGALVGVYPFERLTPEVNFSPDGTKLALVGGNRADIWNLQTAERTQEITLSGNSGGFVGWVGERYLLLKHVGLVDLELGMAIWSYYLPSEIPPVVLDEGILTMDLHSQSAIYSMPVPHDKALQATRGLTGDRSRLLALKPGAPVRVQVTSDEQGVDLELMRAGLEKAIGDAGWKVTPNASTVVAAHIGRGEKQTLHFRYLLSSILDPGESVKIRPYTASIQIRDGSRILWSRSQSNMVPSLIRLEEGQSLKQAVKQYEKADPEYFERLSLPSKILSPEAAKQVGRSRNQNGKWTDF